PLKKLHWYTPKRPLRSIGRGRSRLVDGLLLLVRTPRAWVAQNSQLPFRAARATVRRLHMGSRTNTPRRFGRNTPYIGGTPCHVWTPCWSCCLQCRPHLSRTRI